MKIWDDVSDKSGYINSNYGWCVYSRENGRQYDMVRATLAVDPFSRQACMYYTNPKMHTQSVLNGRRDHMCTTHVQYFINNNYLHAEDSIIRSSMAEACVRSVSYTHLTLPTNREV